MINNGIYCWQAFEKRFYINFGKSSKSPISFSLFINVNLVPRVSLSAPRTRETLGTRWHYCHLELMTKGQTVDLIEKFIT